MIGWNYQFKDYFASDFGCLLLKYVVKPFMCLHQHLKFIRVAS